MTVALSKDVRQRAIASLERWFAERMDDRLDGPLGNVAAEALLAFFVEEVGPTLYNRGVADAQERLQARVQELDIDVHEDEFTYWSRVDRARRAR